MVLSAGFASSSPGQEVRTLRTLQALEPTAASAAPLSGSSAGDPSCHSAICREGRLDLQMSGGEGCRVRVWVLSCLNTAQLG